jgi:hypothetical protein
MFGHRKLSLPAIVTTVGSVILVMAATSPSASADSPWDNPRPAHTVADSPWDGPHPSRIVADDSPWDGPHPSPDTAGLSVA